MIPTGIYFSEAQLSYTYFDAECQRNVTKTERCHGLHPCFGLPLIMLIVERYDILLVTVVPFSGLAFLVLVRTSRCRLPYPPGPRRLPVVENYSACLRERNKRYIRRVRKIDAVSACLSHPAHLFSSTQLCSGSDVIHVGVMGSYIVQVILNSIKSVNDLLEKRSSIYSDRYDRQRPAAYIISTSLNESVSQATYEGNGAV